MPDFADRATSAARSIANKTRKKYAVLRTARGVYAIEKTVWEEANRPGALLAIVLPCNGDEDSRLETMYRRHIAF